MKWLLGAIAAALGWLVLQSSLDRAALKQELSELRALIAAKAAADKQAAEKRISDRARRLESLEAAITAEERPAYALAENTALRLGLSSGSSASAALELQRAKEEIKARRIEKIEAFWRREIVDELSRVGR